MKSDVCANTEAAVVTALAAAGWGDTVTICNGTYHLPAPLSIPAGVTLAGVSPSVVLKQINNLVENNASASVLNIIGGNGARITKLTVRGPPDADQYAAIWVEDSDNVRIDHVRVYDFARSGFGYGVVPVGAVDDLVIEDSYFEHNRHGVTSATTGTITDMIVRNNSFVNQTDAAIDNHPNATGTQILSNTIMQGPDAGDMADGIILQGTIEFLVDKNTIDMGDSGRHGILIQAVSGFETELSGAICNNTITNVGNTSRPGGELGVAIDGDADQVAATRIVLSQNTASGANMALAFWWDSPAGLTSDPTTVPNTVLIYP